MSKHWLKLLVLMVVLGVTPAASGHRLAAASATSHERDCPDERARLAAEGYDALPVSTEGDPAEGSLFDPGRRSAVFAP